MEKEACTILHSLFCLTCHRLLILHMGLPAAIKSSVMHPEPCSISSGKTQERCLSPEHLRHWMLWSTEETKTLKCISFSFFFLFCLMKPECFTGHSSHTAIWKQTVFNAQLQTTSGTTLTQPAMEIVTEETGFHTTFKVIKEKWETGRDLLQLKH